MELDIKNENIRKFLEKVDKDPELQTKLAQIRDPEEAYELAASVQEGFTKEEFVTEMQKMYKAMLNDISEEDLGKIAGGVAGEVFIGTVAASVSTVGTAIVTGSVCGAAGAAAAV